MKDSLTPEEHLQLAQALDVAARRGAYGAAEMATIGALHSRLVALAQGTVKEPYIRD